MSLVTDLAISTVRQTERVRLIAFLLETGQEFSSAIGGVSGGTASRAWTRWARTAAGARLGARDASGAAATRWQVRLKGAEPGSGCFGRGAGAFTGMRIAWGQGSSPWWRRDPGPGVTLRQVSAENTGIPHGRGPRPRPARRKAVPGR